MKSTNFVRLIIASSSKGWKNSDVCWKNSDVFGKISHVFWKISHVFSKTSEIFFYSSYVFKSRTNTKQDANKKMKDRRKLSYP